MKPIRVGLVGLGTVGGGTVEVLRRNREEIARRAGRDIVVRMASARDLAKPRGYCSRRRPVLLHTKSVQSR